MSNERNYPHQFQNSEEPNHTWGMINDIVTGAISQYGVDCVYIKLDGKDDPTNIDTVWGEMKAKNYTKGYGMRIAMESLVDPNFQYNFSHFGYADFSGEQTFYIPLREFYQRMTGVNYITETEIIDGEQPTGYTEADILAYHPAVGDLIWCPIWNTMYQLSLVDDKNSAYWQKYSVWKCTAKKLVVDPVRMKVDITGSEGHGLTPDALDIAPMLPKINEIENVEKLTPTSIDPTVTGNHDPDPPPAPINKNIEIEKPNVECTKNPNSTHDIFGDF